MSRLFRQLISYFLVGITSNSIGFVLYLFTTIWLEPKVAMTLLYFIGIGLSYIGNRKFTFSQSRNSFFTFIPFFALYILGYFLNLLLILFFVDKLGYQHQYVQAISIFVVAIFLFIGLRLMVFTLTR